MKKKLWMLQLLKIKLNIKYIFITVFPVRMQRTGPYITCEYMMIDFVKLVLKLCKSITTSYDDIKMFNSFYSKASCATVEVVHCRQDHLPWQSAKMSFLWVEDECS